MNGYHGQKQDTEDRKAPNAESREDLDRRKREYALRIMEALSGVEEDLLDRCNDKGSVRTGENEGQYAGSRRQGIYSRKKFSAWKFAQVWAAVLCFAAVGAASWIGLTRMGGLEGDSTGSAGPQNISWENNSGGSPEAAVAEGNAAPAPGIGDSGNMFAEGGQEQMAGSKYEFDGAAGGTNGNEGGAAMPEKQEQTSDSETSDISDSMANAANEGENFRVEGGYEEAPESAGMPEGEPGNYMIDKSMEGCLKLNARNYTKEEVKALEEFRGYIPATLPKGYVFESAYSNLDLEEQNLTVCWSRGMDRIMLSFYVTDGAVATVDIDKPETYDERLYEIPFGETVPEEYREVFDDPVFAWEDLELEIIKSRMLVFEDRGDTSTPRGNFQVLYPDGMLLKFNGRGTAEEIWDMLCSMGN